MKNIKNIGLVGAGPASLSFAINYKLLCPEADITIYEKELFPRHKIGESLLLPVSNEFKKWGILDKAKELFLIKKGASYKWGINPDKWWNVPFTGGETSFHVRRSIFDMLLSNKAIELGIKINFNVDIEVEIDKNNNIVKFFKDKKNNIYKHEYYIDGSGLNKSIIKQFNNISYIKEDKRIAFYGYLKNIKKLDSQVSREGISIISFDKGWIWHIPLDDNITSIGIVTTIDNSLLFNTKEKYIKFLKNNKNLQKFITDENLYNEWGTKKLVNPYSVKNWSYTNGLTYGKNWLAIGDAAYFHDPILSQGVTLAITSGNDAALGLFCGNLKDFYKNYYKEYISLKKMTDFWYKNNNIEGWKNLSSTILKKELSTNIYEKEAFSYLTLGNIFIDNYEKGSYFNAGFPQKTRKILYKNLYDKDKQK